MKAKFPVFIATRRNGEIDTEQLWAMCLYEHSCENTPAFSKVWKSLSWFQKLKLRYLAFIDPVDFVSRILAVHCRDIMSDVQKRVYRYRRVGE